MQMKVCVEVELTARAGAKHLSEMRSAAKQMTDDVQSVRVSVVDDDPKAMLAEFTMPKARQMDVVDKIGRAFALYMEDYGTLSIWFPRPPTKKRKKRPRKVSAMKTSRRSVRSRPLPRKHHFTLNPYREFRATSCPDCHSKTGQRRLPLMICIDPRQIIALNYTNRYCKRCDMLIGHQHEIERLLTAAFLKLDPEAIGNPYLIVGTVERKVWLENAKQPKQPKDMRPYVHEFKSVQTLRMTMAGWFPNGVEPPIVEPPPSVEWVKK